MCALVSALKAVPIYPPGGGGDMAGSAANPTYSVGITDDVAKINAAASAKTKSEARLVPAKIEDVKETSNPGAAGLTKRENKIVDDLTSRNPASDPARDEAWTSSREDSSTLGDRPSIDRQDIEDVRGLLRRESTRGKRKPDSMDRPSMQAPSVPTISEPQSTSYADYAPQPGFGGSYQNQASPYSAVSTAYRPTLRSQPTQYQSAQSVLPAQSQDTEMSQVGPTRKASNPYRKRSESIQRKPLSPTAGAGDRSEGEFENTRPYSGV